VQDNGVEKDYYKILGIDRTASKKDIIKAYRKLAAQYHPDKHQGNPLADLAEEKFKEINEAYQVLTGGVYLEESVMQKKPKTRSPADDLSADAKEFMYRGVTFFNEGRYGDAIDNFERALHYSQSPALFNLLGLAFCGGGEYRKAVAPLVEATKRDDGNGKYFFDAGYAFYQLKMWDAAIQHLLDAYNLMEDDRRLGAVCVYLAICNYHVGKSARAEFFLEEATNYDPENTTYRLLLEEFRRSQEEGTALKSRILSKFNRFAFTSGLEDSLGNIFKTIFTK
jgi:tetratricopeptide (TPR) repeat protein